MHGLRRHGICEVFYFRDTFFFFESVYLRQCRNIHCESVAFRGDGDGDVHGRNHDARAGDTQWRNCHIHHLDADGGITLDHGRLFRRFGLQRQHVVAATYTDGEQGKQQRRANVEPQPIDVR